MKKIQSILIISIMIMSAFPLVATVSATPELKIIDGWEGISIYKGKPPGTGGGGGSSGQEKDWGYMRIGSDDARAAASGTVTVAVLDTGVDPSHPDLQGVLVACFSGIQRVDLPCDDRNVKDDQGHGTHVAGTIAALDNEMDTVGVAAGHVQIINGKVLGRRGGSWDDLAWSIRHAADLGADVISMSLGGDLTGAQSIIDMLQDAIDYAHNDMGVAIIAAAGNEGDATCSSTDEEPSWPAKNANVIAVGATGLYKADGSGWATEWTGAEEDVFPCFSNSGNYVDIAAPGVYITASARGGGVTDMSGTSMATPHVAALMALLMAGGLSNSQAESRMYSTALFLPNYSSTLQGHGLIQADLAV